MSGVYARAVVWLRWPILVAWIAAAALCADTLRAEIGAASSADALVPSGAPALQAARASVDAFGYPLAADVLVVQRNPRGLPSGVAQRTAGVARQVDSAPQPSVVAVPIVNDPRSPISREHDTATLTYLYTRNAGNFNAEVRTARRYAQALATPRGTFVGVTGAAAARLDQDRTIRDALPRVTIATVAMVVLVLGLMFRSLAAPIVPLCSAGVAYVVARRALQAAGDAFGVTVPQEIDPLLVVLLLAMTTDYAIFVLHEQRRAMRDGTKPRPATAIALSRVAPIILTAGVIVAAGTSTLALGGLAFFRALGPGLAVSAAIGTLVSLTLTPALAATLGGLLGRRVRPADVDETRADGRLVRLRGWLRRSRLVATLIVLACVAGLAAVAAPLRDAHLGLALTRGFTERTATARATGAAQSAFVAGAVAPTELVLRGPGLGTRAAQLGRLEDAIARQRGVSAAIGAREEAAIGRRGAFVSRDGSTARLIVFLRGDPFSAPAIATVRRLDDHLPELLAASGLRGTAAALTGATPLARDTVDASRNAIVRLAAAALLVNLLCMILFLRAIVAPLYLIAASSLALLAALGATTVIARDVLGHDDLAYYVPFAATVLLLSLGSDYNVFVVGRIWQEARRRDVADAVAHAAPEASLSITAAGIVMALSFAALALVPLVAFQQLALLMAIGVLIDALVVRSLLVPALVTAVGEVSGWPGRRLRESAAPEPSADAPLEQRDAGEARDRPVVAGEHPVDAATRIERLAAMSVDGDEERPPRGDREEPA
jgi:RND superfamily putative drug exporter